MPNQVGIYSQGFVPLATLGWDASVANTLWKYDGTMATTAGDPIQYWDECTVPPNGFPLQRLLARNTYSSLYVDADGMYGVQTRGMEIAADTRNDMGNAMVFVVYQKTALYGRESIFGYEPNGNGYIYSRQGNPPSTSNILTAGSNVLVQSGSMNINTKYISAWQIYQGATVANAYNMITKSLLTVTVTTPIGSQPATNICIGLEPAYESFVPAGIASTIFHEIYYYRSSNPSSKGKIGAVIRKLKRKWKVP